MQIKYVHFASTASQMKASNTDQTNRVRTLTGKEIELDIEPDYKVRQTLHPTIPQPPTQPSNPPANTPQVSRIKERVEEKEGIPPQQQRLIYGGKQM